LTPVLNLTGVGCHLVKSFAILTRQGHQSRRAPPAFAALIYVNKAVEAVGQGTIRRIHL